MMLRNLYIVLFFILFLILGAVKSLAGQTVDPHKAANCKPNCSYPSFNVTNDQITTGFLTIVTNAMKEGGSLSGTELIYVTCKDSNTGYQSCWYGGNTQFTTTTDYTTASPNTNLAAKDINENLIKDSDGNQLYCPLTRCDVVTDDIQMSFVYDNNTYNVVAPLHGGMVGPIQPSLPFLNGLGIGGMRAIKIGNPSQSNVLNVFYQGICLAVQTPAGYTNIFCKNPSPPIDVSTPSCTAAASNNSKTFFSVSGRVMECVQDTLNSVFSTTGTQGQLSIFQNFQVGMQAIVQAALVLYVIFFGIHIAIGRETPSKGEVLMFFFKMLLVVYFSVGLSIGGNNSSGTVDFLYPLLTAALNSLSDYVFLAANNQICNYDPSDYNHGYGYLALWDSVDCRLGYYLGLYSIFTPSANGIFGIISLIFPAFFAMEFLFVIFIICLGVFLLSIVVYFVHVYILALLGLTIMAYLAPIFVPCALFESTKSYFDAWVKLMLSYTLQPVVISAFLAVMLSIFDHIIFDDCAFSEQASGSYQYWVVNQSAECVCDPTTTPPPEPTCTRPCINNSCTNSFGYQLNNPNNIKTINVIFFTLKIFNVDESGPFFLGLVQAMIFVFIFYFFAQALGNFAAELTGGNSLSKIAINPAQIAKDAINKAKEKMFDKTKDKEGVEGVKGAEANETKKEAKDSETKK